MLRDLDSKGQLTSATGKTTLDMELELKFRIKKWLDEGGKCWVHS